MKLLRFFSFLVLISCVIDVYAFSDGGDKKNQRRTLKRIIIDPGHGGNPVGIRGANYGASSKYGDEKDIALAVAFKLQKTIEQQLPEVEVVLTRTTDVFESVTTKAEKANAAKGDLFISLHCDGVDRKYSEIVGYTRHTVKKHGKKITKKVPVYKTYTVPDSEPKGASTLIWNIDRNQQKEGAIAGEVIDSSDDIDIVKYINDPIRKMEIALRTRQYFDYSNLFAHTIQDEFVKGGRVSRGVWQRQEGIWVLAAVNMPAVLIEMGYLSNDEEAQYLASEKGQQETADEITEAIKRYKFSLDNKMNNKDTSSSGK